MIRWRMMTARSLSSSLSQNFVSQTEQVPVTPPETDSGLPIATPTIRQRIKLSERRAQVAAVVFVELRWYFPFTIGVFE